MLHKRISFWLNHRLHRIILPILVAITVPTLTASLLLHPAYAATITWDGEGADGTCGGGAGDGNKWSCALNWLGDTLPGAGDAVVFDTTSTKNATVDAGFTGTITSISINAGYTGTITMARSLTTSATFAQADGVFTADSQSLTIGTNFSLTGGAFTASSGTTLLGGNFTHSAGTFTHNSGIVQMTGASVAISGATTFNNLYLRPTTNINTAVTFPTASTTTIIGNARLIAGVYDDKAITVASDSSGVVANVDFQGNVLPIAAHFKDIANIGVSEIRCYSNCIDNGNDTNIRFGAPGVTTTKISGNVTEAGSTATFTVALRGKPEADVAIPLSSSDITEAVVSPSSLAFTAVNYATPQTVTVTGVDDTDDDGGISSSVVLGSATSSDALYGGLNPADVSIFTEDDETNLMTIDLDSSSTLSEEDVKGTVAWFDAVNQGTGIFKTGSGGSAVNLSAMKIQAGCRATVGGVDYLIGHVSQDVTGQVLLTDGVTSADSIYLTLVDAAVTKITCTVKPVDAVKLGGSMSQLSVLSPDLSGTAGALGRVLADDVNGRIWVTIGNTDELIGVSSTTGLEMSRKTTGDSPEGMAIDPTRNRLWVASWGTASRVTAYDASTGDYAFGTFGASSFLTGAGNSWGIIYNPEIDEIWVTQGGSSDLVERINPVTGAIIGTIAAGGHLTSLIYDSIQHVVWFSAYAGGSGANLVKITASTGAYTNGTLGSSQYPIAVGGSTDGTDRLILDATRNVLWQFTNYEVDGIDRLTKIDPVTGNILAEYVTGPGTNGMRLDETAGKIYVTYATQYLSPPGGSASGIYEFDVNTGDRLADYAVDAPDLDLALQSNGTLWAFDLVGNVLHKLVLGASPVGKYYTTLTTASSNLDFAGTNKMASAVASESLDGGNAYYALSFDARQSFKAYSGGWRTIASSLATDHGGVNGNWYYRNDASVWTPAPTNTSAEAISLAVENGATNNRMTSTILSGILPGSWATAGGFSLATANLDLAVTLETDSLASQPAVDSVAFTLAGEGSSVAQSVTNASVSIVEDATCVPTAETTLHLVAANASSVRVSNEPFGMGDSSEYIPFVADESIPITPSASGSFIRTMTLPWILSPDEGEKTVYAQFRTATGGVSSEVSDTITLSAACSVIPPVEPVVPIEPPVEPVVPPAPGGSETSYTNFVRTETSSTVYFIGDDGVRHSFISAVEFFTYVSDFTTVQVVSEEILQGHPLGKPMPPKPGTVLVKIVSSNRVYAFDADATIDNSVIHWVPTEELATKLFGVHWADYIIDLDPTAFTRLVIGAPFDDSSVVDASHFMKRTDLVERIANFLRFTARYLEHLVDWASPMNLLSRIPALFK
ncbi:MAG: hypothetical protein WC802_03350 [Patescibacteria group bacterium]|jgi:hypothetical protein